MAAVIIAKNGKLAPRLTTEGADDDAEVVVEVLSAEEVDVVVDGGGEEAVVNADDELLADWEAAVTLHCRTTCTRGSPFDPLTGVNVIVHVSVTGPSLLQQQELVNSKHPPRITTTRTSQSSAPFGWLLAERWGSLVSADGRMYPLRVWQVLVMPKPDLERPGRMRRKEQGDVIGGAWDGTSKGGLGNG